MSSNAPLRNGSAMPSPAVPYAMLSEIGIISVPSVFSHDTSTSAQLPEQEAIFTRREAAIDFRIGLNLLGDNGRQLFAEYLKARLTESTRKG